MEIVFGLAWTLTLLALIDLPEVKGHVRRNRVLELTDLSLYDGDKVDEFLELCSYPENTRAETDADHYFRASTLSATDDPNLAVDEDGVPIIPIDRCKTLDIGTHAGMSYEDERDHIIERFEELRRAQALIRAYRQVITTRDYYFLLGILLFCVGAGVYLVLVGHYHWRTLLDEFHPDGSHGVPCWQYLRMRYVAAKVRRTTKNKTLLVPIFGISAKDQKAKEDKNKRKEN